MSQPRKPSSWEPRREIVLERDRQQCVNCLASIDSVTLDPDHSVPRGVGGSDRLSNINTLCRRCHKAKHGEGIAPTVQIVSSGQMTDAEFWWFKHFVGEMIPAMAEIVDVRLIPKFGLEENDVWHLPLGDIRRLDQQLLESEVEYQSLQLEEYM